MWLQIEIAGCDSTQPHPTFEETQTNPSKIYFSLTACCHSCAAVKPFAFLERDRHGASSTKEVGNGFQQGGDFAPPPSPNLLKFSCASLTIVLEAEINLPYKFHSPSPHLYSKNSARLFSTNSTSDWILKHVCSSQN